MNKKSNNLFVRDAMLRYLHNVDVLIDNVKSNELKNIRQVFLENIGRVEGLLILPGFFAFNIFNAQLEETQDAEIPEEKDDLIVVDHLKWIKESSPWEGIEPKKPENLEGEELLQKAVEVQVNDLLNGLYFSPDSKLYPIGEGLLLSSVVMIWTAIESVAKDAWVNALNSRPKILSQMIAASKSKKKLKINREFQLWELARHDFNMEFQMGTLLSQKYRFSSVSGIVDAYEEMFGISNELKSKLENQDLKYLECLRHLIVHKGGIVDNEFIRRTQAELKIGQKHSVSDQDVSNWLDIGFSVGEGILIEVEKWLEKHPN